MTNYQFLKYYSFRTAAFSATTSVVDVNNKLFKKIVVSYESRLKARKVSAQPLAIFDRYFFHFSWSNN